MPTPDSWRGEAERLSRYTRPEPKGDESFVARRLRTDPRFQAGWNSALWEVYKMVDDGMIVTPALLRDLTA